MTRTILALLVFFAVPSIADANKCSRRGKQLWTDGEKYYELSNFEKAIENWEEAYFECDDPELLFNLAQAYRKAGNLIKARDLFKTWLREHPNPDPADKADVEKKIVDLEAMIATQTVSSQTPPEGLRPKRDPASASPPSDVGREPPPAAKPSSRVRRDNAWYQDEWGWILSGAGVAAIVGGAGAYMWGSARAQDADVERYEAAAADLYDDAETGHTVGVVSMSVGGALLVGGILLFIMDDGERPRSDYAITVRGRAVGAVWSF